MQDKYLTIGAITRYLKYQFDSDKNLQTVFLKGEISNFKVHTAGHLYFSLKDETSKINAIMFNHNAKSLLFKPKDGSKVLVRGRISIYEATGNYQIYVDEMLEDGMGNLYLAFEKLKEKLSKEGLFDEKYKKEIPAYPSRVGIVTASTGAAIRDILTTIKKRYPICETILFPSLVQGENAKDDIVRNIEKAQNYDLDVLIVGRGGGSIEDLWPFNEEIVARAIFNSKVPIISGVGHEIDFTIADFVADRRAVTPTDAAVIAVPNIIDIVNKLKQFQIRINENISKSINYYSLYLDSIKNSFVIKNPLLIYDTKLEKLDILNEKINKEILFKLDKCTTNLDKYKTHSLIVNPLKIFDKYDQNLQTNIAKLELLNPLGVLSRGYSVTYKNNKVLKDIKNIKINDKINIKLAGGSLDATVNSIMEDQ